MRMKNLASLRLGRHVVQTRPGGVRHIVIPAEEVKNRTPLAFEVSRRARRGPGRLSRPMPADAGGRSRGIPVPGAARAAPRRRGTLADQIKRTIRQETGIDLNPHAFRHLAAKLFLAAHPGEYETVRLLLGHKRPQHDRQSLLRPRTGRRTAPPRRPHRSSSQEGARMTRQPPIADWPARDRELWKKGVEPRGLFEGGGAGADWSAATRGSRPPAATRPGCPGSPHKSCSIRT